MTNEEFQKLILDEIKALRQEVGELKQEVGELKQGQIRLEHGQAKLEQRQTKLDQGQIKLEQGQKEIKLILEELDPKNTSRHLELKESINELRKDLSTVEIVTASNYADIAKLKSVK